MGILGTLCLIFIVLKLVGVITWSWFWILSPAILSWTIVGIVYFYYEIKKTVDANRSLKRTMKEAEEELNKEDE